jgi:hypothetical protein
MDPRASEIDDSDDDEETDEGAPTDADVEGSPGTTKITPGATVINYWIQK